MISIDNLGAIGMLFDRQPHEIPPEAWSSLRNCRCIDKNLFSTYGHQAIMGVPLHKAWYITNSVDISQAVIWAYAGLAKITATDGTTHQDITRAAGDYTGTDAALWNGGNFGGITIFNNGVDVPQAWIIPALGTPLVNLANWPANTVARVVRPFGRFLVALDVTVSGTRKSTLVKWSDEADIGTVPVTWDPADATKKAGEWPLLETAGACMDMLPLGERNIIYKSDSGHTMTRIAGRFVFAFRPLPFNVSILAQRCVAEYQGKHVVATAEDVVIHDGFQVQSILDDRMQRWYAGRVDQATAFRSFLAMNHAENEVWTCIPEAGHTYPNIALITNIKDGTSTVRELQDFSHIDYGRPPGQSQVYDAFTIPFDSMVGYFGQSQGNSARKRMIAIAPEAERNVLLQSSGIPTSWSQNALFFDSDIEGVADGLRPSSLNANHRIWQLRAKQVAEVETWTLSIRAKADGYDFLVIGIDDLAGAAETRVCFNLLTGELGSQVVGDFPIFVAGSEPVDADGYRRLYLTIQSTDDPWLQATFGVNQTDTAAYEVFVGDTFSRVRVKDAQVRKGLLGTHQGTTTLPATTGIFLLDSGADFDGVAFTARAERTGLAVIGQTRTGEPRSDINIKKLVTEVMPKMEMIGGTPLSSVSFYVGMQELLKGAVTWSGPFFFAPGTDLNFFPDIEGRLIAIAIETANRNLWRLDGYDIDVKNLGKY